LIGWISGGRRRHAAAFFASLQHPLLARADDARFETRPVSIQDFEKKNCLSASRAINPCENSSDWFRFDCMDKNMHVVLLMWRGNDGN
jgi:hypothetical protein